MGNFYQWEYFVCRLCPQDCLTRQPQDAGRFRGQFCQEAGSTTTQSHLSEKEPKKHESTSFNHATVFPTTHNSSIEMFPCALTSERCSASFRPQFLAF